MDKVKILVVEDEIIIADNICAILEGLGYEVLEPAISYTEALEILEEEKPDLALLDIQLAGRRDGIDLAWKIKDDYDIPFIFLTSNADALTIERAKKVNPPAYLLKPFHKNDLYTSIEIALYNHSQKQAVTTAAPENTEVEEDIILKDALFIKHKQVFQKVKFEEILYLKSDHVYVKMVTVADKEYLIRGSISKFLERLPSYFFKVHRSYVINLNELDAIGLIKLTVGKHEIPIGKSYKAALMKKVQLE